MATAFASAASALISSATSASTVAGAGAARYADDLLHVGGLPALGLFDDHEPLAAEEAHRVARRDHVLRRRVARVEMLGRVVADAVTQAAQRAHDLRPVAAGEQIGGLQLGRRHDAKHRRQPGAPRSEQGGRSARADLRPGRPAEEPRAAGEIGRTPAVEPREQRLPARARPARRSRETSASPSIGATTGAAAAFAGTVSSGIAWNWNQQTGAVPRPQAAEIATGARSREGSGYPSSTRWKRGTSRKIESTAANDSWKPGSSAFVGIPREKHDRRDEQRRTSAHARRPLSHARDASDPATPARITDGCGPTASTYAAIAASTASSALSREMPNEPGERRASPTRRA